MPFAEARVSEMDELSRRPLRCILHLDLDCFYAQVESKRLGLPEDEPLAVQQWGGLLAINYAARAFGIKRGMRVEEAMTLCPALRTPHVPLVGGDGGAGGGGGGGGSADEPDRSQAKVSLERYRTESTKIFALLESLAPELERASIDEAYIDATELAGEEHARVLSDPEVWARAVLSLNPGLGPGQSPGLSPASASALASASAPASASASLARRCVLVSTRCVLSAGVGAGRRRRRGRVAARSP